MNTLALDCGSLFWVPSVARAVVEAPRPSRVRRVVPVEAPRITLDPVLVPESTPILEPEDRFEEELERWDGLG